MLRRSTTSRIVFIIILFLSLHTLLTGQQLRSEKTGDRTGLVLLLPYSGFHPDIKTQSCNYTLNVDILDTSNKNVFHQFLDLSFVKPVSFDSEVYPLFFHLMLKQGTYTFYMQLLNQDLGDKNEQKFIFNVEKIGKKIGTVYLVGSQKNARYWVSDLSNIRSTQDTFDLHVNLAMVPDSVKCLIMDGSTIQSVTLLSGQVIHDEITLPLHGVSHPVMKLQVFAQKVKYTKEILSASSTSNFDRIYKVADQVEQLRYIMNQNELKNIRSVKPEKYRQAIEDFWKMKDPTPDTRRNEFREAFEGRIMEADRNFSIRNYRSGWQTDRGKIFVKYGPPDEVASDAYPMNKPPYIIWYYYSENKIFQFNDLSGWGNYQLGSVSDE